MAGVTAILSMLHEGAPPRHSAARLFRGRPVLAWTLNRLAQSRRLAGAVVICWSDQLDAVAPIANEAGACVLAKTPRTPIPQLDQVSAALRWSDGWRGGLLGACHFDGGFYAPFVVEAMVQLSAEAVLLIDPSSGLVDAQLIDRIIEHADAHPANEFFFTQVAPGLAGPLLRRPLVERLSQARAHPGRLLAYSPDAPGRDPITGDMCVPVPAPVARTLHRFTLDSQRQIRRIEAASADLNGHLIKSDALRLLAILDAYPSPDPWPRDLTLELNTNRATRPIFAPATHLKLGRAALGLDQLAATLDQLGEVDDLRLTLGGAGDPLLHPQFGEILRTIKAANVPAVHIETDLVGGTLDDLSGIDMLSVHLPAAFPATYASIMGVDAMARVLENLKRLLSKRRALPLVIPTFTKCRQNLAEMEAWYDHWLRVLGTGVILGPSDYAAQIPDHACADMSPARRKPCARLQSRMTILSDATVASCEQDVRAIQAQGHATHDGLLPIWQQRFPVLRQQHLSQPLCAACREWHRP